MKVKLIHFLRKNFPKLFPQAVRIYQDYGNLIKYGDRNFPRSFSIEISKFCNRTCSYCPNSSNKTPVENIDLAIYDKICDRLAEIEWCGVVDFIFYNEPMLHPDLPGLVRHLKKKVPKCLPRVITNGDFLNVDSARELIDSGVASFSVSKHIPIKPGWEDRIERVSKTFPGAIFIGDLTKIEELLGLSARAGLVKVKNATPMKHCYAQRSAQHIDINGNLLLCCNDYFRKNAFGNLMKEGIMDIWNQARYSRIRDGIHRGEAELKICQECFLAQNQQNY